MGFFKAVAMTFIAIISSFSILVEERFIKVLCIVCSSHLVKCALSNNFYCFVVYFYVIWSQLVMFFLCKYKLAFTPNENKVNK